MGGFPAAVEWTLVILILKTLTPARCHKAAGEFRNGQLRGTDMIKLKHIYKSYTLGEIDVPVLQDVNLHVKPHEFVSILGPFRQRKIDADEYHRLPGHSRQRGLYP